MKQSQFEVIHTTTRVNASFCRINTMHHLSIDPTPIDVPVDSLVDMSLLKIKPHCALALQDGHCFTLNPAASIYRRALTHWIG